MAIVEVSIVPLGLADTGVSEFVAEAIRLLEERAEPEGLHYQVTAMGTIIEGEIDRVLAVVRDMHETPFAQGIKRVITTIKIDDRRDKQETIQRKVEAIREKGVQVEMLRVR